MEHIVEPTPGYDFTQLTCISPSSIAGGNYFIRILQNSGQKPLYIQPPKCSTKQGIIKSGKKMYCDLLFKHEDEQFTEFLECLESFCRSKIFQNKDKWFDSDLTEEDIEESFSPTAKLYKSGKLHSVRVNIPIRMGKCSLKVYNEEEQDVEIETVRENIQLMTILEVQGIRCSARNFQIDMEVKQMMTLKPVDLFEKCVFAKPSSLAKKEVVLEKVEKAPTEKQDENPVDEVKYEDESVLEETEIEDNDENEEEPIDLDAMDDEVKKEENETIETKEEDVSNEENPQEPLADPILGLNEVDLELPNEEGEMKLKKRNDVYYDMYKEAKRKARIARDFAIASYLEAKQIRHNFLEEDEMSEDDDKMEKELENLEKSNS
jgi:hypothetical protein